MNTKTLDERLTETFNMMMNVAHECRQCGGHVAEIENELKPGYFCSDECRIAWQAEHDAAYEARRVEMAKHTAQTISMSKEEENQ